MNVFLEYTGNIAAFGGSIALVGSSLAALAFFMPARLDPQGAWYLRYGRGRWFRRDGHDRGFAALHGLRTTRRKEVALFEELAHRAARTRSWVSLTLQPFMWCGTIAYIAAFLTLVLFDSLPSPDPSRSLTLLALYMWASLCLLAPVILHQQLPGRLLPSELLGALRLGDALARLTFARSGPAPLGSSVARALRQLEACARRSYRVSSHGRDELVPATRRAVQLAEASRQFGALSTGSIEVGEREGIEIAWGLAAAWRPDSATRRFRGETRILWSPRRWQATLRVLARFAVVANAVAAVVALLNAVLIS